MQLPDFVCMLMTEDRTSCWHFCFLVIQSITLKAFFLSRRSCFERNSNFKLIERQLWKNSSSISTVKLALPRWSPFNINLTALLCLTVKKVSRLKQKRKVKCTQGMGWDGMFSSSVRELMYWNCFHRSLESLKQVCETCTDCVLALAFFSLNNNNKFSPDVKLIPLFFLFFF